MQKPKYYSLFYADIIFFAALFGLHRAFTFVSLNAGMLTGSRQGVGFFVGTLSDLWMAGLLSLLTAGVWRILLIRISLSLVRKLRGIWLLAVTLLLASHQSYVEFFGFTMMAFHLRYLYDSAFIMANGPSLFDWPLIVYLVLWLFFVSLPLRVSGSRFAGRIFLGVLILLLVLHKRNIHWRVQWFIPENLQMNLVEKLYDQFHNRKAIDPIRLDERARLAELLHVPEIKDFRSLLTAIHAEDAEARDPLDRALRNAWKAAVDGKRKPILAVLLLESLRPSETGYFAPGTASLTPALDQLASHALVFTNAYSTGSVTRGGQEAVFCGAISSRDTSLMRFDAVAPIRCLPDVLGPATSSFWYHGGNGLFDNQASFWRKHRVSQTLTQEQFARGAPHTSWGVGDITFLQRSAQELIRLHKVSSSDALIGVLLTVSNHIPWDLPADVIPRSLPLQARHPSYRTTAYADHAIGVFAERMKQAGIWDDMLLVLVSDHGNLLPAYENLYSDAATTAARLQSHINFMISGGLTEKAIRQGVKIDHLVSQADVSQLIAQVAAVPDFLSMGENPFTPIRRLPVLPRLEQHLFDPAQGFLIDPAAWRARPLAGERELDLLYYRAYIDFISTR